MDTRTRAIETTGRERVIRPSPTRGIVTAVILILVVGLAAVRFASTRPTGPVLPPLTTSTLERVATLELQLSNRFQDLGVRQELTGLLIQAAAETGNPTYFQRAESILDEADMLDPGHPQTMVLEATLALARHDFQAAVDLATDLNEQDPFNSQALVVLVDGQIELGNYNEATDRLQELLDLRPALPALTRTSYLRELHGDLPGAEQAMVQAITAGSRSPFDIAVTTSLLGDLYLKQGDLDRAEARYLDAKALNPELLTAAVGQARVAIARNDFDNAATILNGVVDRFPEPGALTLLGEVQAQLGRATEAQESFNTVRVITRLQQDAGAKVDVELARFASYHGDPAEAVGLARSAYADRPTVFAAQVLGWSLYRAGDFAKAAFFAEKSLELGTLDASLLLEAAVIFENSGSQDRAEELRMLASDLDPWYLTLNPDMG